MPADVALYFIAFSAFYVKEMHFLRNNLACILKL